MYDINRSIYLRNSVSRQLFEVDNKQMWMLGCDINWIQLDRLAFWPLESSKVGSYGFFQNASCVARFFRSVVRLPIYWPWRTGGRRSAPPRVFLWERSSQGNSKPPADRFGCKCCSLSWCPEQLLISEGIFIDKTKRVKWIWKDSLRVQTSRSAYLLKIDFRKVVFSQKRFWKRNTTRIRLWQ